MVSKETISTKVYNIEDFFSERIVYTPPEQRYYAWTSKHAKKLWNDLGDHFLSNHKKPNSKDYFLGSVLLYNDDEELMVFDG